MSFAGSEADRMLSSMLMPGTIEAVDYQSARVRVRVGDWVSAWRPWCSASAGAVRQWRPPSVGEQAMILSPSGQPESGMIMPGFYTDQHGQANDNRANITASDWPDGAREHYDHDAHEYVLSVPAGGRIALTIGATTLELRDDGVTLTTPKLRVDSPDTTFTGDVLIQQLLTYLGGMRGKGGGLGATASIEGDVRVVSGDVTADSISLKSHTHTEQGDGSQTSSAQ